MKHILLTVCLISAALLSAALPEEKTSGAPQETVVMLEGRLLKLKVPQGEAVYRLALVINQKEYDVAYACSSRLRLDLWEKQYVRIEGKRKWLPGKHLPCIDVRKVTPLWNR